MFRKVETLEKEFEKFKKSQNEIKEILKDKIIIDVKYVNAGAKKMMLIDSGAPKSIVSNKWLEGYLKDAKVSDEDGKKKVVQYALDFGRQFT